MTELFGPDFGSDGPRAVQFQKTTKPITDRDIEKVVQLDNLKQLWLACGTPEKIDWDPDSCMSLSERSLASLGQLESLQRLQVWGARITPNVVQSWRSLADLEILVLVNTNASNDVLSEFPVFPKLRTLVFADAELSDIDERFVARLPNLTCLVLKGTRVSEDKVEFLQHRFPDIDFVFAPQRGGRFLPYTWSN